MRVKGSRAERVNVEPDIGSLSFESEYQVRNWDMDISYSECTFLRSEVQSEVLLMQS